MGRLLISHQKPWDVSLFVLNHCSKLEAKVGFFVPILTGVSLNEGLFMYLTRKVAEIEAMEVHGEGG